MLFKEYPFDPFFLIASPLAQTLSGWLFNVPIDPPSQTELITLTDGDKIAIEVSTPAGWVDKNPTIVMVHGLCGSHKSASLIRLTKKLLKKDQKVIRLNLRGCGSGRGLAKKTYHSGKIDDVIEVLKVLKNLTPNSPIILIGFSLGGNIVLRLAGDLREEAQKFIKMVIALSPPVDIEASVKLFEQPENKLYLKYFTKYLREDLKYMRETFRDFPEINFSDNMTLNDFNTRFIVPFFGFKDLDDYYRSCSAKFVIPDIQVPCKVLLSQDDPLITWQTFEEISIPKNMDVYITRKGGHMGYVANPLISERRLHFLDGMLFDWLFEV
jgi:uncharacterized protein